MKTDRLLMAAGLVAAFTAALHTFIGTAEIQAPLLQSTMPRPVSLLLFACWHLVSVTLILSAAALLWSAVPRNREAAGALPRFISLLWLSFGLLFVVIALWFGGTSNLLVLPQWTLLIPVGILGFFSGRKWSTQERNGHLP